VGSILQEKDILGLIADYIPALEKLGGQQWDIETISNPAPLLFFVVTGGTEQKILRLRERRKIVAPKEPVFLLAHPGNNSLPAALEVLARLRQDGDSGRIFCLRGPEDTSGFQQLTEGAGDLMALHALQQARIGQVGAPSDWLVASSPDPEIVHKIWGPEVVPIDLAELKGSMETVPDEAIKPPFDSLVSKATGVMEPSPTELENAVRVYLAMKQLVDKHKLNSITLRCFVGQLKTSGCFALAQLNDQGIIAGCEGDLVSTVAMLWIFGLLGRISWMANPARIDVENSTLWLAHCTVPRSMVEQYRLRSHFESGLGVGIQGRLPAGPVTLLRIGGKAMEQIWLAEGEIIQTGETENLCRTQAKVRLTGGGHAGDLLRAPLGNHLVLVPGHHAARLRVWWETMISSE
jgi:L-fucose isomerase-like protein